MPDSHEDAEPIIHPADLPTGTPRWVKMLGLAGLVLVVLLLGLLLTGHMPVGHMP